MSLLEAHLRAPDTVLYLANVALAVVLTCAATVLAAFLFQRRSAPTRSGLLLQSRDGVLRIFPHWDGSEAGFRGLRAVGGFLVSATFKNGRAFDVSVTSQRGRRCRLASPWKSQWPFYPGRQVRDAQGKDVSLTERDGLFEFDTRAGETYRFQPVPPAKPIR